MPDKLLTCQNCQNPFVYSEYEQNRDQKLKLSLPNQEPATINPEPLYCPICASIKASAAKRPSKPQK